MKKKEFKEKIISPEEKMLRGYQRKLTLEAVVKSLVFGLMAGFLLSILVSIISFATAFNALWISLGVWAAASVGFTLLFYFKVFRTTLDKTASRVDGIGLDERVITMIEFANSDSVMAQKQRQDTADVLQTVTPKRMKFGGLKVFIIFTSLLAAIACAAILMMSFSTINAVKAEDAANNPPAAEEPALSEEDEIIKKMLEELRKEIDEANIKEDLRAKLHGMVDDLEARLKPSDSTDVKVAKIVETRDEIHKILQDTIPWELQQRETTKKLGDALVSEDIDAIEKAFQDMYDSIAILAGEKKYEQMQQTAYDILDSIEDAQVKDDELAEILEELAKAFLDAIPKLPPPPEGDGDEPIGGDEIDQAADQAVQDAIQEALDKIKDQMQQKPAESEEEALDKDLQDTFDEALGNLGYENEADESEEEEDKDKEKDEESSAPSAPPSEGDIIYNAVIDGKTPYNEVYEKYYERVLELLESGAFTDEQRQVIEKYFNLLN